MKVLGKYFWRLIGPLLALLAIFATYNVFLLSQPKKELQIIVDSPVSLVDVRPEAIQEIQVFYKREPVSRVYLLQIQIKNSGNQPITESDYSRPLTFSFPQQYKLADAAVTASEPSNIGMIIAKTSEYAAQASSTLLNPGESVSARFIIIGADGESIFNGFSFDGRIVGIKEIRRVSSDEQQPPKWLLTLLGVIMGVIMGILLIKILDRLMEVVIQDRLRKKQKSIAINNTSGDQLGAG